MIDKETILIRLGFEPVNRRDENSLLVHACPGDTWEQIGSIPGMKVPKVTQAINNNERTSMSLRSVKDHYVFSISSLIPNSINVVTSKIRGFIDFCIY